MFTVSSRINSTWGGNLRRHGALPALPRDHGGGEAGRERGDRGRAPRRRARALQAERPEAAEQRAAAAASMCAIDLAGRRRCATRWRRRRCSSSGMIILPCGHARACASAPPLDVTVAWTRRSHRAPRGRPGFAQERLSAPATPAHAWPRCGGRFHLSLQGAAPWRSGQDTQPRSSAVVLLVCGRAASGTFCVSQRRCELHARLPLVRGRHGQRRGRGAADRGWPEWPTDGRGRHAARAAPGARGLRPAQAFEEARRPGRCGRRRPARARRRRRVSGCSRGEPTFPALARGARLAFRRPQRSGYAGHWVSPPFAPRGFETDYFLAHVPDGQEATVHVGELAEGEWCIRAWHRRWRMGHETFAAPILWTLITMAEGDDLAARLAGRRAARASRCAASSSSGGSCPPHEDAASAARDPHQRLPGGRVGDGVDRSRKRRARASWRRCSSSSRLREDGRKLAHHAAHAPSSRPHRRCRGGARALQDPGRGARRDGESTCVVDLVLRTSDWIPLVPGAGGLEPARTPHARAHARAPVLSPPAHALAVLGRPHPGRAGHGHHRPA